VIDGNPNPTQNDARAPSRLWLRVFGWAAAGVVLFLLLLVVSVALLLRSGRVHAYLLHAAERQVTARLGTRVSLENFTLHLSTLTLDLYGLTVDGAPPYPQPPLLQVQHATIGVRIVSILHREWYLDTLRIDQPVVRLFTAADGSSNLPTIKTSGAGHTSVFDLGIRNAMLAGGEVDYNNRKSTLTANLRDVDFHATFNALLHKYSGELHYRRGVLQMGAWRPIQHDLDVRFSATPQQLHLQRVVLSAGASSLTLAGQLQNYSHPQVQANYQLIASGAQFASILRNPAIPAGMLRSTGTITYQDQPDVALLNALVLHGTVASNTLQVRVSRGRLAVQNLQASLALTGGNFSVSNLKAQTLGGSVDASYQIRNLSGPSRSQLTAAVRGLSLARLQQLAQPSEPAQPIGVQGTLNADASANWGVSIADIDLRANATAKGEVYGRSVTTSTSAVPIQAALHVQYLGARKQVAFSNSRLQLPSTSLVINGTLGRRAGFTVQIHSSNLAELEDVADLARKPAKGQRLTPLGLAGTASFVGTVRGTTAEPDILGTLSAQNLQILGTHWKLIHSGIEASPSVVRLQNAELVPQQQGHITLDGSVGLQRWALSARSNVRLHLDAANLQVADFTPLLGRPVPVTGTLRASIAAHGSIDNPVGHGTLLLTRAEVYGQPVKTARVRFTGTGSNVLAQLEASVAGGSVTATTSVQPQQRTYIAKIALSKIQLARLHALAAQPTAVAGTVDAQGSGQGSFSNPQFDATLHIPRLTVEQQALQGLTLHAWVANHTAMATLDSQAIGTYLQATAQVELTGNYAARGTLNTHAIPLAPLLALYAPAAGASLAGETEIHASFQGPLKDRKQMEAHITLPVLKLNYGTQVQLAATQPIQIDYQDQVLNLRRSNIRGTDTDLQFQGRIPVGTNAPVSLLLLGTVNLRLAQAFSADVRSSGEMRFDINSYGARTDPNVEGKVEIVNASFANGTLPVGLQHANGVLVLTRDRLNIQSFTATVGGGTVTAQGGLAYRPSLQFDLGVAATGVRLLYPQGVREELAANLRFTGTRADALLAGRVQVQDLSFTPQFDLTSFIGNLSGGVTPPPSQGFSQNTRLNVQVNSTSDLNPVSRALSVDGTANLQVRGTVAQPVILGRINLNGGDLIFNGNRFTLAGGTVEFINPSETQPVVNVSINTTIEQYDIHLRFNGPVDQLHTNYSSDPALPTADIINLLAFGQTTEAAQANPVPGNQAAISAVASQVSSQITSRVAKIAGISQLSINPVLSGGTAQGPAGAIVTVQQRVTSNLFVTFSTNVTTTQDQVILGQYNLSRRTSVSATRDQNGGFAFDTTFKRRW
jgi:translocation and assembly module TamB